MNTTETYSSESSWTRRCSIETIFSVQGRETDFVRDTSDTEWCSDGRGVEFEPVTEPENEVADIGDTSGESDNEIISTMVVEVSVFDDASLQLADSERTASSSDSELDLHDYWLCASCRATNNTPFYRYCEKCFRVRKNFFPPRPKPKRKPITNIEPTDPLPLFSQDSGVESLTHSQGSDIVGSPQSLDSMDSNSLKVIGTDYSDSDTDVDFDSDNKSKDGKPGHIELSKKARKRPPPPTPRSKRKRKRNSRTSDPRGLDGRAASSDSDGASGRPAKRTAVEPEAGAGADACIACESRPKSGVFVHGRVAHICCCYACAVRVWRRAGRCPLCNRRVSNVLRAVVA